MSKPQKAERIDREQLHIRVLSVKLRQLTEMNFLFIVT